jgi:hypothetical protein
VWKMVPTCLFWCLWEEINNINFEDNERSMEDIISMFFETLYLWTATYVSPLSISFSDFLSSFCSFYLACSFCILSVYLGALHAFNEIDIIT